MFLCTVCLALGVFFFFYGTPLAALAYAKWQFRNSPKIWTVPEPLASDFIRRPEGPKLIYFGYEFESPLAEATEEKKADSVVVLSLSDCAGMSILKPGRPGESIRVMQQEASNKGRSVQDVFGNEATRSSYAFRSKILNLTPADLRLFSSRQDMARNSVLLLIKGIESQRFENGLFSFESSSMRGFQEGDIARDKGVVIEAFDQEDRLLTLIVARRPGKACFGQPELNHIIFSLRPVAASE